LLHVYLDEAAKQSKLLEQQSKLKEELAMNEEEKLKVLKSKEEALKAIEDAKSELLTHTFEMMLKNDMITPGGAEKLKTYSSEKNSVIDMIIDTYASNRDVNLFIRSLQAVAAYVESETELGKKESASSTHEVSKVKPDDKEGTEITEQKILTTDHNPTTTNIVSEAEDASHKRKNAVAPETDNASALTQREQIELSQILIELAKAGVVKEQELSHLLNLVKNKDEELLASYELLL
jgi:hypothetical protein